MGRNVIYKKKEKKEKKSYIALNVKQKYHISHFDVLYDSEGKIYLTYHIP
jgi:hypothetical protein